MSPTSIEIATQILRKQEDLPRFVLVPEDAVREWNLEGTTLIDIEMNGVSVGPRTIRKWDANRWFVSVTQLDCRTLGVDTGDTVRVNLIRAADDLPAELEDLIARDALVRARWERLSVAQQRMLVEDVRKVKRPETRTRRALKILGAP